MKSSRTFLRLLVSVSVSILFSTAHANETIENTATGSDAPIYGNDSAGGSAGGANTAMISQLMGAGSNAAAGAMYQRICSQPHGGGWACPMAAISYAQAGMMLASAFMSGKTRNASTGGNTRNASTGGVIPEIPTVDIPGFDDNPELGGTTTELDAAISEGLGDLRTRGYTYDPKTGTLNTPTGDIKVDANTTPGGLAAAMGGSASDIKLAKSTALSLNDQLAKQFDPSQIKASVSGVEVDGGGGGGGGGGSSRGPQAPNLADYFKNMQRGPASASQLIAGKSLMLGGESIGIKVDNLFDMVHRRYQDKRKSNTFLEPAVSGGVQRK
jgi:hypothetical protein